MSVWFGATASDKIICITVVKTDSRKIYKSEHARKPRSYVHCHDTSRSTPTSMRCTLIVKDKCQCLDTQQKLCHESLSHVNSIVLRLPQRRRFHRVQEKPIVAFYVLIVVLSKTSPHGVYHRGDFALRDKAACQIYSGEIRYAVSAFLG